MWYFPHIGSTENMEGNNLENTKGIMLPLCEEAIC